MDNVYIGNFASPYIVISRIYAFDLKFNATCDYLFLHMKYMKLKQIISAKIFSEIKLNNIYLRSKIDKYETIMSLFYCIYQCILWSIKCDISIIEIKYLFIVYLFKTKKSAMVILSCVFIDVKLYIINLRSLIKQFIVWSDHKFNTFENTRVKLFVFAWFFAFWHKICLVLWDAGISHSYLSFNMSLLYEQSCEKLVSIYMYLRCNG